MVLGFSQPYRSDGRRVRLLTAEFFALIAIGFFAQLVDGALGMAFGLISTTALLSLGYRPLRPAQRFILPR